MLTSGLTLQDLQAMTNAAGNRPVILINPRLKVVFSISLLFFFGEKYLCFLLDNCYKAATIGRLDNMRTKEDNWLAVKAYHIGYTD